MTTLFSTQAVVETQVAKSTNGRVVLWVAQLAVGATFLMAGGATLAGAPAMVAVFHAIAIGQWFRYVTGLLEVSAGLSLFVPPLAPHGAIVLTAIMLCAVATHVFVVGGSLLPALVLLLASAAIAWGRRDQLDASAR